MDYIHHYDSPLGGMTMASDGKALVGLWFDGQKFFAGSLASGTAERDLPLFDETDRWLDIYFSGKAPDFTPGIRMRGTEFRVAVWDILLTIPFGCTVTYGQIADRIAEQKGIPRISPQAVGGAVGHNPISLIIPCHRVIGADGSLTGYAGGIDRKRTLLKMEGVPLG